MPRTRCSEYSSGSVSPSDLNCLGLITCSSCPFRLSPVTRRLRVIETPLTSGGNVSVTRQIFTIGEMMERYHSRDRSTDVKSMDILLNIWNKPTGLTESGLR